MIGLKVFCFFLSLISWLLTPLYVWESGDVFACGVKSNFQ